jgi:hypothetical protein
MENINIIVIEDQREVLQAIGKDLIILEGTFMVEECESAAEARQVMDEIESKGDYVGLIISDQVMTQGLRVRVRCCSQDLPRITIPLKRSIKPLSTNTSANHGKPRNY